MGGRGVRERGGRISSQDLQRSGATSYSQHAFSVSYHNECWYTTWYRGRQDLLSCSPRNARNSHLFLQFSKILCFYCLDTDKWVRMFSRPSGTAWKDVLPGCTSRQDSDNDHEVMPAIEVLNFALSFTVRDTWTKPSIHPWKYWAWSSSPEI